MTFKRPKARILELTITAGNGPYTVTGAIDASHNTFASFMSIGDTTFASVVEPGVAFWTGSATYSAANQITLTTVEETKGTFGAGTKEIMAGPLAARGAVPDDIAGAIVTGGTSTAYTVTSFRVYDSLARMSNALIAFTPHATNGATVTLNVDGLGAKPLRLSPLVELQSNVLIAGTPYMATYNNSDAVWYLHGLGANAYGIPLGGGMDFWGATAPSSAFAFPTGQQLSQTTYAGLYAVFGPNRYGADGGGNFYLPDKTEKVSVMKAAVATLLTTAGSGIDGATMGAIGGAQSQTLTAAQIPTINSSGNNMIIVDSDRSDIHLGGNNDNFASIAGSGARSAFISGAHTSSRSNTIVVASTNTGGGAHRNVQPTIVCNYIIRVL